MLADPTSLLSLLSDKNETPTAVFVITTPASFVFEKKDRDGKIIDYEINEAALRDHVKRHFKIPENELTEYEKFLTDMITMVDYEIPIDIKEHSTLIEAFRKAGVLFPMLPFTTSQPTVTRLIRYTAMASVALAGAFVGLWQLMINTSDTKETGLIDNIILGFLGVLVMACASYIMYSSELFHNLRQYIKINFFQHNKENKRLAERLKPTISGFIEQAKNKGETYHQTLLFILNVYAALMEKKLKIIAPVSNNALQLSTRDDAPLHHEMLCRIERVDIVVDPGTVRLSM